jgi:hypothetical protein
LKAVGRHDVGKKLECSGCNFQGRSARACTANGKKHE